MPKKKRSRKTFAKWLVEQRRKNGWTQDAVARFLGVSSPRISEWERGTRTPKPLTQIGIQVTLAQAPPRGR